MSPVEVTKDWPLDSIAILRKLITTLFNDDVLATGSRTVLALGQ